MSFLLTVFTTSDTGIFILSSVSLQQSSNTIALTQGSMSFLLTVFTTSDTGIFILSFRVITAELEHDCSDPGVYVLLADRLHHLRHRHLHPLLPLRSLHEEAVKHGHPLAQHGDLQLVLILEVVHELL